MSSSESFLEKMNKIKVAWMRFVTTGEIDTLVTRPVIADSKSGFIISKTFVDAILRDYLIKK